MTVEGDWIFEISNESQWNMFEKRKWGEIKSDNNNGSYLLYNMWCLKNILINYK